MYKKTDTDGERRNNRNMSRIINCDSIQVNGVRVQSVMTIEDHQVQGEKKVLKKKKSAKKRGKK